MRTMYLEPDPLPMTVEEPQGPSYNRKKILFVDHDTASYRLVSGALARDALEIIHAGSGSQAVSLFRDHPDIAAVITEIRGPGLNGFELLRAIRQINPRICVIAQTAMVHYDMEVRCLEAGFNEFISKPLNLGQLAGMVKRHVR